MAGYAAGRIALLIDGPNLYATAKALGFEIDFKRLLHHFEQQGSLLRAFYFSPTSEDHQFSPLRPLMDWLAYNRFTVVTKASKEFLDASGNRKVKANLDVDIAVKAMEIAREIDQMTLFSGDGSFRSLVRAVQRRGVQVTVVSTASIRPAIIADELRRQADLFIDLAELQPIIGRGVSNNPGEHQHPCCHSQRL